MRTELFSGVTAIMFEKHFELVARFDARAAIFLFFVQCVRIKTSGLGLSKAFYDSDNAPECKIDWLHGRLCPLRPKKLELTQSQALCQSHSGKR